MVGVSPFASPTAPGQLFAHSPAAPLPSFPSSGAGQGKPQRDSFGEDCSSFYGPSLSSRSEQLWSNLTKIFSERMHFPVNRPMGWGHTIDIRRDRWALIGLGLDSHFLPPGRAGAGHRGRARTTPTPRRRLRRREGFFTHKGMGFGISRISGILEMREPGKRAWGGAGLRCAMRAGRKWGRPFDGGEGPRGDKLEGVRYRKGCTRE